MKLLGILVVVLLSGCAALREPPQVPAPKFLPVEIISELSGFGCEIHKFSHSQSQRGEQTLVECK